MKIETKINEYNKESHRWWHFWYQRRKDWNYYKNEDLYKKERGFVCDKCGYEYQEITKFEYDGDIV